jgi:phosphoribosylaminoimidazole-succinocarboxamide synthase
MIYTIKRIDITNFHHNEIIISEPAIVYKDIEHESMGKYGFRVDEIGKIVNNDKFVVIYNKNKIPKIELEDEFNKKHKDVKNFIIGLCAGRPLNSCIKYLNNMGFNPIVPIVDRDLNYKSNDYMILDNIIYHVKYIVVKSSDIIKMTQLKIIDAVMCYGDVWYNLDEANFNIKYVGNFIDELKQGDTYVSLIAKKDIKPIVGRKIRIGTEYNDAKRLLEKKQEFLDFKISDCEFIKVNGSVESYLLSDTIDFAITIVQTGYTLEVNNLKEIQKLRKIYLNMWIYLDPFDKIGNKKYYDFFLTFKDKNKLKYLIIEGIDGAGKSSILKELQTHKVIHDWVCFDRYKPICNMTLKSINEWSLDSDPVHEKLYYSTEKNTKVIIIESDIKNCVERISTRSIIMKYEEPAALSYFRLRYRELAGMYGYYLINNDGNLEDAINNVYNILKNDDITYKLPSMIKDEFNGDIVTQGESKIVRKYNWRFDIIQYKPSVYSHKQQRSGIITGTNIEREKTTRNLLYLLALDGIIHTYWCVFNNHILAEKIRTVPPVEVCVKRFHIGTHKHIYYKMLETLTRTGDPLVDSNGMYYKDPIVRFDWRNPNHLQKKEGSKLLDLPYAQIYANPLRKAGKTDEEIEYILLQIFPDGIPLGDYAMPEDLADKFINVKNAKQLVSQAFLTLEKHFELMSIRFKDVCFMPTVEGDKLYGEVSQDCGRYEYINLDGLESLDKDIWRAGGSSELVLEKWKKLSEIIQKYVDNFFINWNKEIGLL